MDEFQQHIIQAAIRAPSGDNCQPWKFNFRAPRKLDVYIVPKLAESFFDVDFCATYISVGAVIENIRLAAGYLGYTIDVEYAATAEATCPAVTIQFIPHHQSKSDVEYLHDSMMARTVNRRPYLPKSLAPAMWEQLLNVELPDDVSVVSYVGEKRNEWIRAIRAADNIRWSHPQIHTELFDKIRYSSAEATEKKDGLEIDRLGIGPGAKWVMKFLSSWRRQQKLNKIGCAHVLAEQTVGLVRASAGLVGVWANDDSEKSWIRGGEITQRLWIRAHQLGLAVQPLSVCLYLKRRADHEGQAAFEPEHQKQLRLIEGVVTQISEDRDTNKIPVMLFRVGKALPMKTPAVRKSIDSFI